MSETALPAIAIFERNRSAAQRIARVVAAASSRAVYAEDELEPLEHLCIEPPQFIAFDAADYTLVHAWVEERFPGTPLVVWCRDSSGEVLQTMLENPDVTSVIAWPSFKSFPRAWELTYVTRRLIEPDTLAPKLTDLLQWGATSVKFRPRTSGQRDKVVSQLLTLAERLGTTARVAELVGEVAHELLMNAMYDAPVDSHGALLFAQNRRQDIELHGPQVPTLRMSTDGTMIGVEVTDSFGRLRRNRVIERIHSGMTTTAGTGSGQVLDMSHGGAGLGLFKAFMNGTALLFDVRHGDSTRVTWLYDQEVSRREFRSLPRSLHIFESQ